MARKTSVLIASDVANHHWARKLQQALRARGLSSVRLGVDPGDDEKVAVVWLLNRRQLDAALDANDYRTDDVLGWLEGPPLRRMDPVLDAAGYRDGPANIDRELWSAFVEHVVQALIKRAGVRPPPRHDRERDGTSGGDTEALRSQAEGQTPISTSVLGSSLDDEPPSVDREGQPEMQSVPDLEPLLTSASQHGELASEDFLSPGDQTSPQMIEQEARESPSAEPESTSIHSERDRDVAPQSTRTGVFICYRRHNAEGYAGRIYDRLTAELPATRVFMDVDNIQPGEDFAEVIEGAISECRVMLILIARGWVEATDRSGVRLIDRPDDFVRFEITRALERKLVLIPVLVGGASVPGQDDLPDSVAPLSRRHAIELRHASWRDDVTKLMAVLRQHVEADARLE